MRWLRTPFVPPAVAFGAGIALTAWVAPVAWVVVLVAAVGMTVVTLFLTRPSWAAGPLLVSVAALGALRALPMPLAADHVARLALPRVARVEGRIVTEPRRFAPDRTRFVLDLERLDDAPRSGQVLVTLYGKWAPRSETVASSGPEPPTSPPPLSEGQRVVALGARLRPAEGFRNPLGFDYAAFLGREGIHAVGSAPADRLTIVDDRTPWHARVKQGALSAIERALPRVSGALLGGLLLGTRGDLPRETLEDFRRAGVYHVLAVSGFNVALVAGSVFAALLMMQTGRRVAAVVAGAVVIGFACVVGPEPSVLRAAIMAVLVLVALLLEREAYVMNSLAVAAIAILVARPGDLLDPGFQLSFAATAGIVLVPLPGGMIRGALAVSLAAQLAVLPISLSHFNQVSPIGILANLAVVPLAAVATVVGLVAVALSSFGNVVAAPLFNAVWPVLLALRGVVRLAASTPGALVHFPAPHWTAISCYVASLLLALAAWRVRETRARAARAAGAAAGCLMVAAVAIAVWPIVRPSDGRLRVTFLDVGQGDAIVVEGPNRRTLLVDAGSGGATRLDVGERVVAPYLWNHGVLRLAAAITTHGDVDHAGGMAAVRRLFRIDHDLTVSPPTPPWWLSPVALSIWSPLAATTGAARPPARNDEALVVRLEYGAASFLLTSDIGAMAERALLARRLDLRAVVLKVGHHGSRTSSTPDFLRAVRPTVAVISVGSRNSYGHPNAEILERLTTAGAHVYRTDRDGALVLETDGRVLEVTRWSDRRVDRYCLDPEALC